MAQFLKTRPDLIGYDTSKIKQPKDDPIPKEPFIKKIDIQESPSCKLSEHGVSEDFDDEEHGMWVRVSRYYPAGPSPWSKTRTTRKAINAKNKSKEWAEAYREGLSDPHWKGKRGQTRAAMAYRTDEDSPYFDGTDERLQVRSCLSYREDLPKDDDKKWGFASYARFTTRTTKEGEQVAAPRTSGRLGRKGGHLGKGNWRLKSTEARMVPCPECGVDVEEPCQTDTGKRSPNSHKERVMIYVIDTEGLDVWFNTYEKGRFKEGTQRQERIRKEHGEDDDD